MFQIFQRKHKKETFKLELIKGKTYPIKFDYADRFCEPVLTTIKDIVETNNGTIIKYTNNYNVSGECTREEFLQQHSS